MTRWLGGPRGAAFVVLLWVVGWGLGFGGLTELFIDPDGETHDIWPAELAIPGFVGGILFAAALLVVERRRFEDVPLVRFTGWGVVSGLALGVLSQTTGGPIPLSLTWPEMMGLAAGLGAVAGFGTGVFFRLITHQPPFALSVRAR
jgi:hypothetical protein